MSITARQKHKFTCPSQIIEAAKTCNDPVDVFMWGLWLYLHRNKPLVKKICRENGFQYVKPANAYGWFQDQLFQGTAIEYPYNSYEGCSIRNQEH